MTEIKGYTCDGGCGATTMSEDVLDSIARRGWFTTFTPNGLPTWHTCSAACLVRVVQRHDSGRGLPA